MSEVLVDPVEPIDRYRVLDALRTSDPMREVEPGVLAGEALRVQTPEPPPENVTYHDAVVIGDHGPAGEPLTLHVLAQPTGTANAGVLFIHGGGFQEGYPEMVLRFAMRLAARGYTTAACTYRLSGDAPWPACMEDVGTAATWLVDHAVDIGLDPSRLGVCGGSAGGTLAALAAAAGGAAEVAPGVRVPPIAAAMLLYPATELRPGLSNPAIEPLLARLFRGCDPAARGPASPVTHVTRMPPTLTLVGDVDPVVPVSYVDEFHAALTAAGVENHHEVVSGAGHSFDFSLARWDDTFATMTRWFDHHLDHPGA